MFASKLNNWYAGRGIDNVVGSLAELNAAHRARVAGRADGEAMQNQDLADPPHTLTLKALGQMMSQRRAL
jgi:hypothetical protein